MDAAVPTIAAVKGPVRAGGIGLMASCDLVVVARDMTFALTEVRIGVAAAIISVPILRRACGAGWPRRSSPASRSTPRSPATSGSSPTSPTSRCHRGRAVRRDPQGCPASRRRDQGPAAHVPTLDRDKAFERMRALSDQLFTGPEAAEGMAAFAEKRQRPDDHAR